MTKKIAFFGIFAAFAIIIAYIERLFPLPIPIPGAKPGFANAIVIITLYTMGTRAALGISVLRIAVVGLLFGSVFGMAYSLAGGLLSFAAMVAAKRTNIFGIVGVSVFGGVFHNMGQIAMAAIIVQNARLFYYAPVLIIAGVLAGIAVGYASGLTLRHVRDVIHRHFV
ncbi:MAG: Gx transporter family protein [Clostridiales bacterium]|jgi:heptaprenyl diphosphate synthase|nr:Gx transporter family protein [Clostridiales bacterium]